MRNIAFAMASAAAAVTFVAGVGGCARSAEERQLDAMRSDIERIQDDRDRADQAVASPVEPGDPPLRAGAGGGPPGAQRSGGGATAAEEPLGPAVRVGADDDAPPPDDYADPDDSSPRPRIRVFGSPRVRGGDVETVDDGAASSGGGAGEALDPQAKRAYDAAMGLVTSKRCDQALDALAAFLVKWPEHPYADHAMYWRGECYFSRGDYPHAAEQFEGVIARFPAGAKVPDALLKLGMTRQRMGDASGARESFARLARDFPQSDAARRIPQESHP